MAQTAEQPAGSHMKDFESHVHALEKDIEYWRVKRLEPRITLYVRRNVVPLHVLFETAVSQGAPSSAGPGAAADEPETEQEEGHHHEPLELRIRHLEDRLDDYVRGIALASADPDKADVVIDDGRTESGAYDPFFRFTKRSHGGTLEERIQQLDGELTTNMSVLDIFTRSLIAMGVLDEANLERRRAARKARRGEWNGARIVARAWVDPEFKDRLIQDGRAAAQELGIPPGRLAKLGVAENTTNVHNVVVCTLCSCYPNELLGEAPWWYRDDSYKQNIVLNPRAVLADTFGLHVSEDVTIQVHDSTSDLRWMVLPERPAGTEGWTEEQLARLVTQESLIGVSKPLPDTSAGG